MRYLHVQDKKMRFKYILLICSVMALAVLPSCKKDDEDDTTKPYLDGTLSFKMPMFVLQGEQFTLVPTGASNPSGGGVGYSWTSSWTSGSDTVKRENGIGDGSWTVSVPSETGSYTVTVSAFAKDYYSIGATNAFTVVDPSVEGTLKGAGYQVDSVKLTDPRDGATYYLMTSGGKVWMQNNLYYSGSGVSYFYCTAMDRIVGRFYNWNEAVCACPEGWHLPSDSEFAALAGKTSEEFTRGETLEGSAGTLMADVTFNDGKMWTFWPQVNITNSTGFSAIPIGYAVDQGESQKYNGTNAYAVFWTSDEDGDTGLYRYIYMDKDNIYSSRGDKVSFRASVRCVRD